MEGLREQKRLATRRAILDAAASCMRERGYAAVPVREIAAIAVVSEATVFNYFPTKGDLASAWLRDWIDGHFAAIEPGRTLRHDLRDRVRRLAGDAAVERALLKRLWPHVRAWRGAACPGLELLLTSGQEHGEVRTDHSASELALLVSAAIDAVIGQWLLAQDGDVALSPQLLRATDLVLDGCRKRNERVRAPAGSFAVR
jgi:AcrR family transcriptional regulator